MHMGWWNGVADCPQCGCQGTMVVHGRSGDIEIEGCWVCGYGQKMKPEEVEFVPLHRLNLQKRRTRYTIPTN